MKVLLASIAGFFGGIFPLHTNAQVKALKQELADADFCIFYRDCMLERNNKLIANIVFTNNQYRKENMHLHRELGRLSLMAYKHPMFLLENKNKVTV